MDWFRWYNGTITDAKWQAIARRTGLPVASIIGIWAAVLENANQSSERGTLEKWNSEDIAAVLHLETEQVDAVLHAMQGRTLDGDRLTGWANRNPKREDPTAAERQRRRQRSRNVTQVSRNVTQVSRAESVTERDTLAREEAEADREAEEDREGEEIAKLLLAEKTRASCDKPVEDLDQLANEVIRRANRGMAENPEIGDTCRPIPIGHASRQVVVDWLLSGVPAELAGEVVYQRALEWRSDGRRRQINSMQYFDAAVREAWDQEQLNGQHRNGASPARNAGHRRGSRSDAGREAPAARRDKYAEFYETASD